jgi:hypothetical protein
MAYKMKNFSGFKDSPVKAADESLIKAAKKMAGKEKKILEIKVEKYQRRAKSQPLSKQEKADLKTIAEELRERKKEEKRKEIIKNKNN